MKPIFAKETAVPVGRSRSELEDLLRKYGADQFASGWREGQATVQFRLEGRTVRLEVPMPTLVEMQKGERRRRTPKQRERALSQAERQRWRAIVLLTRARLEACALGIETIETAFLSGFVTPSGQTVGEIMREQLDKVLDGRAQPKMLGA